MPHEHQDAAFPAPPFGDSEFPPRSSSYFPVGSYEDMFTGLDVQPVLSRPLMHPATGKPLTAMTHAESHCPTFRHQRPRTSHAYPSGTSLSRASTFGGWPLPPLPPVPPMPPSPHLPLKTSSSTSAMSSLVGTTTPHYGPSRSSSTKSNYTYASSTSTAATTIASRSSSTTSRRSAPRTNTTTTLQRSKTRPGPCPLPPTPSHHNSLAELHARQANIASIQSPISPYAEERNPLERMGYVVSGIVRRKSSGMELRSGSGNAHDGNRQPSLKKKSSFARLGWGARGGAGTAVDDGFDGEVRRGSAPGGVDVSRNF